jgi:hypothetical protein
MEAAVIALFVYSMLISAKYLQQRAELQDAVLKLVNLTKIVKETDPYIDRISTECADWKERCRVIEFERNAERETVRRIRAIFEPSAFETNSEENSNV